MRPGRSSALVPVFHQLRSLMWKRTKAPALKSAPYEEPWKSGLSFFLD